MVGKMLFELAVYEVFIYILVVTRGDFRKTKGENHERE